MSTTPSGPPDKYYGIMASTYATPADMASALSTAYAAGYTVIAAIVPSPVLTGDTWIMLSGYSE